MKSLMLLFQKTLIDLGVRCGVSTTRDAKYVSSRFEHEGLSFLTITLSKFGKDFQKSLDQSFVGHDQFSAFAKTGELPRFLGGFLDLVFERASGRLLDDPSVDAIYSILQLTLYMQKIELPCSSERTAAAYAKYIQCDEEVKISDRSFPSRRDDFRRVGKMLWREIFTEVDRQVYYGEILPKHGSGATADKLMGNQKYYQTEYTTRLDKIFPAMEYLLPSWSSYEDLDRVHFLEPRDERPACLDDVPKTLETPRLIAKEPTVMMYIQQGLMESLAYEIHHSDKVESLICWCDQTPNQRLAKRGSESGDLATLDLSEASDRVSNQHVLALLEDHPHLREAVQACRSRKVDVPGHSIHRVAKFASMGSALTFPFESMVFMTIIFLAVEKELRRPLSYKDIKSYVGQVRTYGDDIIVPQALAPRVADELENFGFRVNLNKSFWTGKFRESCGRFYYDGVDVTPIRVRSVLPEQRKDAEEIVSLCSLRNQMYKSGNWGTVRYLDELIDTVERKLGVPLPVVQDTSPSLGRFSYLGYEIHRWDPNLHSPLIKGSKVDTPLPANAVDGVAALLKFFLKRGDMPVADVKHLERSGRPRSVRIMTRWLSPF